MGSALGRSRGTVNSTAPYFSLPDAAVRAVSPCRVIAALAVVSILAPAGAQEPAASDLHADAARTVTAETSVELDRDALVHGDVHSNGDVILGNKSEIDGNVTLSGTLSNSMGTITGSVTQVAPESRSPIPTEADARALADRVFEQDTEFVDTRIDDVVFVDGTARLSGGMSGTGTLIASQSIVVGPLDPVAVEFASSDPPFQMSLVSFQDVTIVESAGEASGTLLAGRDVIVEKGMQYQGIISAHRNVLLQPTSGVLFKVFDETPPQVTDLVPPDGSFVSTSQTEISAAYADPGSGVNPRSVSLVVDGVDRTAEATVSAEGVVLPPGVTLGDGQRTVEISLEDFAFNSAVTTWSFVVDTVPPQISITEPAGTEVVGDASPQIRVAYEDDGAGIDPASVTVAVDGADLDAGCTVGASEAVCEPPELSQGAHTITATVADLAGGAASTSHIFELILDDDPPALTVTAPAEGAKLTETTVEVLGTVTDASGVSAVTVNGSPATVSGDTFSSVVELPLGASSITVTATDPLDNRASTSLTVTVDDTAPVLEILSPIEGSFVGAAQPLFEVGFSDDRTGIDPGSLAFRANDTALAVECTTDAQGAQCRPSAALPDGPITLEASVSDAAGNTTSATVGFTVDSIGVEVAITDPADGLITTAATVEVNGSVGEGVATVRVDGVDASVAAGAFTATVPLREGTQQVVALATKTNGNTGAASVEVIRDVALPLVEITSPRDGLVAVDETVAVTGQVNDVVTGGTVPEVTVNGSPATVEAGTFLFDALQLVRGPNTIEVVATDAAGNTASDTVAVTFQEPAGPRIRLVSGNGQTDVVEQTLAEPLVVEVVDDLGQPVAGRIVRFEVSRNSGTLRADPGAAPSRTVQIPTDGSGRASVLFTLGDTTGGGNNRVRATALGVAGEVELCASAVPAPPERILMVQGDHQRGAAGRPLPEALEALVLDREGNPVAGLDVAFEVARGGGTIDGGPTATRTTDAAGLARVVFTLGQEVGDNEHAVSATFAGHTGLPATFVSTALPVGDPADTRFSGVVLDNGHTPIPGARVTIEGSGLETTTDSDGRFALSAVPVGPIHLLIDPTDSPRPETFPSLAFEAVTVAGTGNNLGQPIVLPAIDSPNSKMVGGTEDVTLTMEGVEGLELTVFAGSTTFPDGSDTGQLTISQVHLDKIPMPPPNGSLFMPPAWTIQPTGVVFDPPARITIPNDGLAPGRIIDIFQFDHTLNEFINVGHGTVSEDAALIVSDPGFGVTRAGWGGCGLPPPEPTCGDGCQNEDRTPPCKIPGSGSCNEETGECEWDDKAPCTACRVQDRPGQCDGSGSCVPFGPDPLPTGMIVSDDLASCDGADAVAIDKKVKFRVQDLEDVDQAIAGCEPPRMDGVRDVRWSFSAGKPVSAKGRKVKWKAPPEPSSVQVTVTVDDAGNPADDGGAVQADTKTFSVVVPDQDDSTAVEMLTCRVTQFGGGDLYEGRVKFDACDLKFTGLHAKEQAPQLQVIENTCPFRAGNESGSGPGLRIGPDNTYGTDRLGLCSGKNLQIQQGGCVWQNETQWLIGPARVPYVTHINTFNVPEGQCPTGGLCKLTTSRTP